MAAKDFAAGKSKLLNENEQHTMQQRLLKLAVALVFWTLAGCSSELPPLQEVVSHYAAVGSSANKPALRQESASWREMATTIRMEVAAAASAGDQKPMRLLFLGDSITQGWRRRPELWQKHFGIYHPINAGIVGDSTQHVLGRLVRGDFDIISPEVVVLMIGVNNGMNSPEQTASGVASILVDLRRRWPHARVVLQAILPGLTSAEAPLRKRVAATNRILQQFTDQDGVLWLDMTADFVDAEGQLQMDLYAKDALHLKEAGYVVWGEKLAPLLQNVLAE